MTQPAPDTLEREQGKLYVTNAEPITLERACGLYPGSKITVSTLRAAADRGHLDIFKLGRRYHTTPAAMQQWVQRCQEDGRRRVSTSIPRDNNGLSETERASSAQAALRATVVALRSSSPATSGRNTNRRAGQTR